MQRVSELIKEPMLAGKEDDPVKFEAALTFPLYASPKLDGIRAVVLENGVYSRKLLKIPNPHVQDILFPDFYEGLDGELIVGKPYAEDVYRQTNSGVMTQSGQPNFKFYVFDDVLHQSIPFEQRHQLLRDRVESLRVLGHDGWLVIVTQVLVHNMAQLLAFEERCLARGYEGVMLRSPGGLYKQGRSTMKQGWLIKMKRFTDAEAECIGYQELTHNDNEATTNELGRTKRSSHKANKRAGGTLGSLLCRTPEGVEFRVGGGKGLTQALRAELWAEKESLIGRLVKYSSLPVGVKDRPRHPKFIGFRSELD